MKKATLFTLAIVLSSSTFAQLRVHEDGKTQVGPVSISPEGRQFEVITGEGPLETLTYVKSPNQLATNWCANSKLSYGFGIGINNNGYIWGDINYPLNLMTWNSSGNFTMGYSVPSTSYRLTLNGRIYCEAATFYSDKRFKSNIKSLSPISSGIYSLNGVSYSLNDTLEYDFNNEVENFGFVAQDVQKVYPNLVAEDENGMLGINYVEMIPLLVEELKKQKKQIDQLNNELRDANSMDRIDNNSLEQNYPNPFSTRTTIKCNIVNTFQLAQIMVFDMNGGLVSTHEIETAGESSITIEGSSLKPGMYLYSLIVDGKEIDTKRMILTE